MARAYYGFLGVIDALVIWVLAAVAAEGSASGLLSSLALHGAWCWVVVASSARFLFLALVTCVPPSRLVDAAGSASLFATGIALAVLAGRSDVDSGSAQHWGTAALVLSLAFSFVPALVLSYVAFCAPPPPAAEAAHAAADGALAEYAALADGPAGQKRGASGEEAGKRVVRTGIKRVAGLAKPEALIIGVATVALFAGAGGTMAAPALFGKLIDTLAKADGTQEELNFIALCLFLAFLASAIFSFIRGSLFTLAGERLVARFRKMLYRAIMAQEVSFFDSRQSGDLVNRLSSDTQVVQQAITVNISMALRFAAQAVVGIIILFFVSPALTGVMLAVVPAVVAAALLYARWVKKLTKAYQEALGKAGEVASETIGSLRTVRSFSGELREAERYDAKINASYDFGAKKAWAYGFFAGGNYPSKKYHTKITSP